MKMTEEKRRWLQELAVGSQVTMMLYGDGTPRSVHKIFSETPCRWILDRANGLVMDKKTGLLIGIFGGTIMHPHDPKHEREISARERANAQQRRREMMAYFLRDLPYKQLRAIAVREGYKA